MRKILLAFMAVMIGSVAMADERSEQVLRRVADYVKALGAYEAEFKVRAGEYQTQGRYAVKGDMYHIVVDRAEVYSDGRVRYEVDHERQEVNVDDMDLSSRNIMDNPTRCFDFVGADYRSQLLTEDKGQLTLHLKAEDQAIEGDIYLSVEQNGRPKRIVYVLYEDRIEVDITSLKSRSEEVERFVESKFKDYEIVDFR